jgi:hypothetical protein
MTWHLLAKLSTSPSDMMQTDRGKNRYKSITVTETGGIPSYMKRPE